jgi:lysophospholipase L1-like esterase
LQLARAQAAAVKSAGGMPVPLAHLMAPQFRATPEVMFSADGYHPSAAAYALAADALLLALCDALGEKIDRPVLDLPAQYGPPELAGGPTRLGVVSMLLRRPAPASPASS